LLSIGVEMIRLPRWFIFTIALLLVLNPAATAILSFFSYTNQGFALSALAIYIVAGFTSVLYYKSLRMPLPLALFNLVLALILPILINLSLDLSARGSHATWYVTGVATLMGINAVRQHKIIAWLGIVVLTTQVVLWGGIDFLFNSGLAGALGLVVAGHAIAVGLDRSAKEAASYLEIAKTTEAASAVDSAVRQERSKRSNETLVGVLPTLLKIRDGHLGPRERNEAKLLEAELRDEIRGRALLNQALRDSVRAARSRGVEVVLLDEGGLEQLSEETREAYRARLATELDQIREGRVTIRAPHQDRYKVTFVASRSGTAKPDVFLKL
jgi:hypothetical protein